MQSGLCVVGTLREVHPAVNSQSGQVMRGLFEAVIERADGRDVIVAVQEAFSSPIDGRVSLPAFHKFQAGDLVGKPVICSVFTSTKAATTFINTTAIDVELLTPAALPIGNGARAAAAG